MESEERIMKAFKAALEDHFGNFDSSQQQLKALLMSLDAKVEALGKSTGPFQSASLAGILHDAQPSEPDLSHSSPEQSVGDKAPLASSGMTGDNMVDELGTQRRTQLAEVESSISGNQIRGNSVASMSGEKVVAAASCASAFSDLGRTSSGHDKPQRRQPVVIPLRKFFKDTPGKRSLGSKVNNARMGQQLRALTGDIENYVQEDSPEGHSRFRAWSPDSTPRRILDSIGIVMVIYEAFMVPFWLAWDYTWTVGFWTTCIFWTIDLPSQFVTGYRQANSRLELDLRKAAMYYMKTWFLLDVTVILCDWIAALGKMSDAIKIPRAVKYLRMMKLVRGGRQVLRFFYLLQRYKLSSQFLEVHLSVDITLLLVFILWVNHCVGCGWYWVGSNADSDTGWTWIREAGVSNVGMQYEYATSLHWALTQMTPASMEVVPECTVERAFNVLMIISGMILGSVFAATLTSSMTQYRLYKERVSNNFMQLQSYLAQQGVEPELSMIVKMHVKTQLRMRQRLQWKNVAYLELASKSLRETLWHSCCTKSILKHPFLHCLNLFDRNAMKALCNAAMTTATYYRGDVLFDVGAEAKDDGTMHYVSTGTMLYSPGIYAAEADLATDDPQLQVSVGVFVSEAALWTEWKHLGTLFVESRTEVLQLSAANLHVALSPRFPEVIAMVMQYAVAFQASLHEPGAIRSDLGSSIDNLDLMQSMDTLERTGLAEPILRQLSRQGHGFLGAKDLSNLKTEIQEGKCSLGFDDGEPVRTVFVVALNLWRDASANDGRFLVKVGEFSHATREYKPTCVLPGTKRKGRETARAAIERVIQSELAALLPSVTILPGCSKTVFLENSPTYGIRTRYLRTTYNASLNGSSAADEPHGSVLWGVKSSTVGRKSTDRRAKSEGTIYRFSRWLCDIRSRLLKNSGAVDNSEELDAMDKKSSIQTPKKRIAEILQQHTQAITSQCGATSSIYVWLAEEEFNALRQETAMHLILSWLQTVDPFSESHQRAVQSLFPHSASDTSPASDGNGAGEPPLPLLAVVGPATSASNRSNGGSSMWI